MVSQEGAEIPLVRSFLLWLAWTGLSPSYKEQTVWSPQLLETKLGSKEKRLAQSSLS